MNYIKTEIKKGIYLHQINTEKFKTNLVSVFLMIPMKREEVTGNALIPAILRRGTKTLQTMEQISIELENMYGAGFDCGIEKMGKYHLLKFYIESINDKYLPQKEEILKKSIELIFEVILNPLTENNVFKKEYLKQEKENLKNIIEGKIDHKDQYAFDRCIEEMYQNDPFGLYRYGYIEDLDQITEKTLYEQYQKIIKESKIDIFISGEQNQPEILNNIQQSKSIQNLIERNVGVAHWATRTREYRILTPPTPKRNIRINGHHTREISHRVIHRR